MEIIHFVGHSCAGKRSLIIRLCNPDERALRERFRITGSTERFWDNTHPWDHFYDSYQWRPICDLEIATADHLLHKWQFRSQSEIAKWQKARPDILHRAIVLWRTCKDSIERICVKARKNVVYPEIQWYPSLSEMKSGMQQLHQRVLELEQQGVVIEYVDASTDTFDQMKEFNIVE